MVASPLSLMSFKYLKCCGGEGSLVISAGNKKLKLTAIPWLNAPWGVGNICLFLPHSHKLRRYFLCTSRPWGMQEQLVFTQCCNDLTWCRRQVQHVYSYCFCLLRSFVLFLNQAMPSHDGCHQMSFFGLLPPSLFHTLPFWFTVWQRKWLFLPQ